MNMWIVLLGTIFWTAVFFLYITKVMDYGKKPITKKELLVLATISLCALCIPFMTLSGNWPIDFSNESFEVEDAFYLLEKAYFLIILFGWATIYLNWSYRRNEQNTHVH